MFAIPFAAPSHDALASHIFGRLMPRPVPADAGDSPGALAAPAVTATAAEDEVPDLAQRVREVGEW